MQRPHHIGIVQNQGILLWHELIKRYGKTENNLWNVVAKTKKKKLFYRIVTSDKNGLTATIRND